jgi:hypothetical protein
MNEVLLQQQIKCHTPPTPQPTYVSVVHERIITNELVNRHLGSESQLCGPVVHF